jgi:hypothetical protein
VVSVASPCGTCTCRLYNKEAIIQFLLDKEKYADQAAAVMHIRGLKDVVTLKLTANKHADKEGKATTAGAYTDVNTARFACPVTDLPMNGHYRFCYLRGCGCVLSEKALREIPSETCHKVCKEQVPMVYMLNGMIMFIHMYTVAVWGSMQRR